MLVHHCYSWCPYLDHLVALGPQDTGSWQERSRISLGMFRYHRDGERGGCLSWGQVSSWTWHGKQRNFQVKQFQMFPSPPWVMHLVWGMLLVAPVPVPETGLSRESSGFSQTIESQSALG